jgi:hypothetical protein
MARHAEWAEKNKTALSEYARRRHADNPERNRLREREKARNNPAGTNAKRLAYFMKWKYNLTIEQYQAMNEAQNGQCGICLRVPRRLVVDHCHNTEVVRGLLCSGCNMALGMFQDGKLFDAARDYIKKSLHDTRPSQ